MEHKKAIVIGATSGIGRDVVRVLTERGWHVGIAGRRQQILQEMQRTNLNIIATECIDVTATDAAEHLHTLIGKMNGIDLYFHSSGIGYQNLELDMEKELATVGTNALGFTRMVMAAFHYFAQRPDGEGHIAVISSIAGTKGLGAAPAYSSTKRYVNHYLECLSQLARMKKLRRLTITDIRPGFVRTPLLQGDDSYPLQMDSAYVARKIVDALEKKKSIAVIDCRYRILVSLWRLVPRWLWIRLPIATDPIKTQK